MKSTRRMSRPSILRVYYMFKLLQDAISFLIAKTRIVEHRSIDVDRTRTYARTHAHTHANKDIYPPGNLKKQSPRKKKRRKTNHRTNYPVNTTFPIITYPNSSSKITSRAPRESNDRSCAAGILSLQLFTFRRRSSKSSRRTYHWQDVSRGKISGLRWNVGGARQSNRRAGKSNRKHAGPEDVADDDGGYDHRDFSSTFGIPSVIGTVFPFQYPTSVRSTSHVTLNDTRANTVDRFLYRAWLQMEVYRDTDDCSRHEDIPRFSGEPTREKPEDRGRRRGERKDRRSRSYLPLFLGRTFCPARASVSVSLARDFHDFLLSPFHRYGPMPRTRVGEGESERLPWMIPRRLGCRCCFMHA